MLRGVLSGRDQTYDNAIRNVARMPKFEAMIIVEKRTECAPTSSELGNVTEVARAGLRAA